MLSMTPTEHVVCVGSRMKRLRHIDTEMDYQKDVRKPARDRGPGENHIVFPWRAYLTLQ